MPEKIIQDDRRKTFWKMDESNEWKCKKAYKLVCYTAQNAGHWHMEKKQAGATGEVLLLKSAPVLYYCYISMPPPTTISATLIVGIASEMGTPWESFPQVPMEKPRSDATISTDFMTS